MTLAQTTELVAMFALAGLFLRWRLKWIFAAGLAFGVLRFALCALNGKAWLLAGITMHGLSFTLYFITAQIYIDERVGSEWRVRAQALMTLMTNGVGNLIGYLGTGWWFAACVRPAGTQWSLFWGVLAAMVGVVLVYFLVAYRGQGVGIKRTKESKVAIQAL
jgi:MFS family permease